MLKEYFVPMRHFFAKPLSSKEEEKNCICEIFVEGPGKYRYFIPLNLRKHV